MGRRVAYVLVFLGFFFVFLAVLLRFYAYPRLEKAPLDQYSQPVATGTGTYFNREQLKEVPAQLQNIRTVTGDREAGTSSTAVWDSFSVTKDTGDNGVLTAQQERIALDRVSGESRECCGEQPRHEGLTLKFPFNTEKRTYSFWDPTAGKAFPATFAAEDRVEGVKVYRFEQRFQGVRLQTLMVSGDMAGRPGVATVPATVVYGNTKTLWVEPRTGIIVKAGQDVRQILETDDGRPVLTVVQASLVYDDATVKRNADDAKSAASRLRMLEMVLPIGALVLGVALTAVGLRLTGGRRRPDGRHEKVPAQPQHPADAV